jgi:transposase
MGRPVQPVLAAVTVLLRPLIRILLRHGIPCDALCTAARHVYVRVAAEEFALPKKKQTTSRVSILTGLTRKEVRRIMATTEVQNQEATDRYNRAARVIAGWVRDKEFQGAGGNPLALPLEGKKESFGALVHRYSGDLPVRAMLDELLRVGAVRKTADGRIRLQARSYVPQQSATDKLQILGADTADLIGTIAHNLDAKAIPRYQRKVMYDNVPVEAVREFQRLSAEGAQALIENLDGWLSQRDRDVNPAVRGMGRKRVGVGIYYFEDEGPTSHQDSNPEDT